MKLFPNKLIETVKPSGAFWGLLIIAGFLLFTRFLFDEPFFLYTFYVVVLYIVLSFLYIFFALDKIEIERKSRYHQRQVGDLFEENILIKNRSVLPVFWMKIRDLSKINRNQANRVIGFLGGRQTRIIRLNSYLQRRGHFDLTPVEVMTSDPLGCFFSVKTINTVGSLVILPYRIDLSTLVIRDKPSEEGKSARQTLVQSTIISGTVRPYLDGDPFNRIHWPTTARRHALHSKQPDMNIQQKVWICMDCDKNVHVSRQISVDQERLDFLDAANLHRKYALPPDTMETVVSITSSLAITWLKRGLAVGLALNNPQNTILQTGSGLRQQNDILNVLTYIQADSNIPFTGMLMDFAGQLSSGAICFLVTPEDPKKISQAVFRLKRTGADVRIILVKRNSYVPELAYSNPAIELKGARLFQFHFGDPLTSLVSIL